MELAYSYAAARRLDGYGLVNMGLSRMICMEYQAFGARIVGGVVVEPLSSLNTF